MRPCTAKVVLLVVLSEGIKTDMYRPRDISDFMASRARPVYRIWLAVQRHQGAEPNLPLLRGPRGIQT